MASKSGVVIVVSGEDKSGEVFKAIDKHMAETRAKAKETSESLGEIGEALKHGLEMAGVAIGVREAVDTLKEAVAGAAEYGENIAKASERTGMAAGTLSVLHYAAATTGTDFEKLVGGASRLGKNMADAADGNKKLDFAFRSIGVNAKDLVGKTDGIDIAFQALGKALAATESPARKNQVVMELLGKAGSASIPAIIALAEHFDGLKKATIDSGTYLDEMSAQQLETLNKKMNDLKQRVLGAEVSFTDGLSPALEGLLSAFTSATGGADFWNMAGRQAGLVAIEAAACFVYLANTVREAKDTYLSLSAAMDAPYWKLRSMTDWTKSSRDASSAHYNSLTQQMHDAKSDHDAMLGEEAAFATKMKDIEAQLLHPKTGAKQDRRDLLTMKVAG